MAINYNTILSSYDDRLTLLEFMNRVLDALENASVDTTQFSSLGNGQYTFTINFADGSTVVSDPVTINGAKGVASFSASNGVLTIGLTDGSSVTANPMNGDISISGSLDVSGPVSVRDQDGIDVDGPISVSGNASVGGDLSVTGDASVAGDLHVTTMFDVDDESDFAGHVEMHNGLELEGALTIDGNIVQQIDLNGTYAGHYVGSSDFDFEPYYSSICRVGDVINIKIRGWFSPHSGFISRDEETIYKIGLPSTLSIHSDDWDNIYAGTCLIYDSNAITYIVDTFRLHELSAGEYELILYAIGGLVADADYELSISFQILVSPDLDDGRP